MSDWQPTDAQIEAALRSFHAEPWSKWNFKKGDSTWNTFKAMLVAAHAAAEPVDTTEFERMLNAFETFSVSAALAYADDRKPLNEQRFVVKQRLIDLYVKAATR